jgi:hypothetical protein
MSAARPDATLPRVASPRRHGRVLGALRRRGWIVPVMVLVIGAVAWVAGADRPSTFRTEAVLQVPAGAGPDGPGSAGEARTLALTYAALVPEDDRVIRAVSAATRIAAPEVSERITAVTEPETAVMRLRFEAESASTALAGATALERAVSGRTRVAAGVAPGTLQLVRSADEAEAASVIGPGAALGLGSMLGLFLGLIALAVWERVNPRVEDPGLLRTDLGCSAVSLDGLSRGSLAAILESWQQEGGKQSARVALVAAGARERDVRHTAEVLAHAGRHEGVDVSVVSGGRGSTTPPALALIPVTRPATRLPSAALLRHVDLVVLIVRTGQSLSDVRRTWSLFQAAGLPPQWAILARGAPAGLAVEHASAAQPAA